MRFDSLKCFQFDKKRKLNRLNFNALHKYNNILGRNNARQK